MLLEKLTSACGLPGFEDEVRDIIKSELDGVADTLHTDRMGNLIAVKNSHLRGSHIALNAHMDEVGLCVKYINNDGTIRFTSWGIDQLLFPSMRVLVGSKKIIGVIGARPIHLQKEDERKKAFDIENLYIDIGCCKKEECEKIVSLGDFVAYDSKYTQFGESRIKAKALDNRVGCAALIELFRTPSPYKLTGIFSVQKEVGMRGSAVASQGLNADLMINIGGTICADIEGVPENEHVTTLGEGPALSLMDKTSIYLRKYLNEVVSVAEKNNIPFQYRRTGLGGTDAGNYHTSGTGTPCIGIAVPCRYIHSPISVIDKKDYDNLIRLISCFMNEGSF